MLFRSVKFSLEAQAPQELRTVAKSSDKKESYEEIVIRGIRLRGKALVVNLISPNEELNVDRDIHVAPLFNNEITPLSDANLAELPLDRIWRSLCSAVSYIHEQGHIHGRLTADKVLWDRDHERLLITGWERPYAQPSEAELYHSPPEVLDRNELSRETDSYYLASMLYTLLTKKNVHTAKGGYMLKDEVLRNELNPALLSGKGIEKELSVVLKKALQSQPTQRFASVVELQDAFYSSLQDLVNSEDEWVGILLYTWMSMNLFTGAFFWSIALLYG